MPRTHGGRLRQTPFGTPPSDTSSRDSNDRRVSDLFNARSPIRGSPRSPRASTPVLGNTRIPPLRARSNPWITSISPTTPPRRAWSLPNLSPNITPTTPRALIRNLLETPRTSRTNPRTPARASRTNPRTPTFTDFDFPYNPASVSSFSNRTPPPNIPISQIRNRRARSTISRGIRGGRGRGVGIRGRGRLPRRVPIRRGGGGSGRNSGDSSGSGNGSGSRRRLLLGNSPNFGPLDNTRRRGRKVRVTTVRKGKPPHVSRQSSRHTL